LVVPKSIPKTLAIVRLKSPFADSLAAIVPSAHMRCNYLKINA
jgi:hypothetical protein